MAIKVLASQQLQQQWATLATARTGKKMNHRSNKPKGTRTQCYPRSSPNLNPNHHWD
ncbi:hypothetical protein COLO4_09830 [Corchorus olitorius]|uniref:Uncharacterized protein n=1 Tax=Corchorus olitorius TaxID=93759 RepID=A0A1R3KAU8_9ROSI|nr:hypothetical protein COLO4_09830 [Corchorus olitorius]